MLAEDWSNSSLPAIGCDVSILTKFLGLWTNFAVNYDVEKDSTAWVRYQCENQFWNTKCMQIQNHKGAQYTINGALSATVVVFPRIADKEEVCKQLYTEAAIKAVRKKNFNRERAIKWIRTKGVQP